MENKSYSTISNLLSNNNSSSSVVTNTTTTSSSLSSSTNTFVLSPSTNTSTTTTPITSSLQTLQTVPLNQSIDVFPNRILTQPVFNKLSGDIIKQERFDNDSDSIQYSITYPKSIGNSSIGDTTAHLNPLEIIRMSNANSHLISSHLSNGTGGFFTSNMSNGVTSNYKLTASSNSDLPSPSNSSNSSNPPSSTNNNQSKRHGDGPDTTRKREVRLQKNRDAARECRRKKKEYIKCLEDRVTGLENQNKALIEELRQLKELYCQRDDSNTKSTTKR